MLFSVNALRKTDVYFRCLEGVVDAHGARVRELDDMFAAKRVRSIAYHRDEREGDDCNKVEEREVKQT